MSATAKKAAMRGTPPPEPGEISAVDTDAGLTAEDFADFDAEPEESPDEVEDDGEGVDIEDLPLPEGTELDEKTGDWLYTLRHEPKEKLAFTKVRIPKVIYAKDIRRSGQGRNETEVVFFMLCSMSKVPAAMMDKVDAKDYVILQQLVQRRALKNSRAVLRAIGRKDGE